MRAGLDLAALDTHKSCALLGAEGAVCTRSVAIFFSSHDIDISVWNSWIHWMYEWLMAIPSIVARATTCSQVPRIFLNTRLCLNPQHPRQSRGIELGHLTILLVSFCSREPRHLAGGHPDRFHAED